MDSNQTLHLKGWDYSLSIFYKINPPSKFYRFDTNQNRKMLTQVLPFINSQKITIETFLERLFWDLAEFIESTDFIEEFCATLKKEINNRPTEKSLKYATKKDTPPSKSVYIHDTNQNRNHNFQYSATYFDNGKFEFDTSSMNLWEYLRIYKREVYGLLKCRNYFFHKFKINFYFSNDNYLEFLKSKLAGYGNEFIRLRFCYDKLTIILKRDINNNIRCFGNVLDVLSRFLMFGYNELYTLLESFDIKTINFLESLRLESYVSYHLAKDIGCNIELEQPELSKRLKLNQMNDMESLANIGLKYHSHYIDFSRYDEYGYQIPEYEIEYRNRDGMSRAELERDLLVLEPDIKPKEQTTIDRFLNDNKKAYILIKGYLPIAEFSIEPNRSISTLTPESLKRESNFNGLLISDKSFLNRKTIPIKFKSTIS